MSKDYDPKSRNPDSQPYNEPEKKENGNPYNNFKKTTDIVFDTSWDLMKFGDCPVRLGDPMACPTPNVPMSACGTRRNAIKHMMRGKGGRPPMILRQ